MSEFSTVLSTPVLVSVCVCVCVCVCWRVREGNDIITLTRRNDQDQASSSRQGHRTQNTFILKRGKGGGGRDLPGAHGLACVHCVSLV